MGRFGLRGNFPVNLVHLQRWSSWTVGLVRPKLPVPLPKIFVSSPTLLSRNQNFGPNTNGSFQCDCDEDNEDDDDGDNDSDEYDDDNVIKKYDYSVSVLLMTMVKMMLMNMIVTE